MAGPIEIAWFAAVGGAALYALISQVSDHQREGLGRIRRTPRATARDLRAGKPVRLRGRVEVDEGTALLRAPISGRECVGWRVTVTQSPGRGSSTILDTHEGTAFWVRDPTGRTLVRGRTIVWPEMTEVARVGHFDAPDERFEQFLQQYQQSLKGILFTRRTTFEEGVLVPGDQVAVAGLGALDRSLPSEVHEGGYREEPGCPVVEPFAEGFVVVSNRARALR